MQHQAGDMDPLFPSVNGIPAYRMPQRPHMHPDLMRPTGQNMNIQQRAPPVLRQCPPFCHRLPAAGIHSHLFPVLFIPVDRLLDPSGGLLHRPFHQRTVMLFNASLSQHPAERGLALIIARNNHQSAGVFIQPVDNARPQLSANSPKGFQMMQQSVDQCTVFMPRSRMNHHPPGLHHNRKICILIDNFKRQVLCLGNRRPGRRNPQQKFRSRDRLRSCLFTWFPACKAVSGGHQGRYTAAAYSGLLTQQHICPSAVPGHAVNHLIHFLFL